jgi:hypothetical protein
MPKLIYVKSPAPEREPRLTEMLARIKDDGGVSYQRFSDAADLQRLVENDLAVLLSERFDMTQTREETAGPRWPGRFPLPRHHWWTASRRPRRSQISCSGRAHG